MWKQEKPFNPDPVVYQRGSVLMDWYGYCLAVVQHMFGAGWAGSTAADAWNRAEGKHTDRNLPTGVAVPIYFDHWGDYGYGYQNYGHIVVYKDGLFYSSPLSHKPTADVFGSIEEIERKYRAQYIGWAESVGPHRVLSYVIDKTSRMTSVTANAREEANTSSGIFQQIDAGATVAMKGYVTNGESVDGNTVWFVTANSGKYMTAEAFSDKGTHDLPDLTPQIQLLATERQVVSQGVRARKVPNTSSDIAQVIDGGSVVDMKGWTHGESIEGNDIWFVSKLNELFLWSGAFTDAGTHDLPETKQEAPTPSPTDYSKIILDVSNNQVDDVASHFNKFAGVILKAGHVGPSYGGGANRIDPKLVQFAKAAGDKLLGLYWLPYFSEGGVAAEAARFIEAQRQVNAPLLFVDLEPDFEGTPEELKTFRNLVLQGTGKQVLTYGGNTIIQKLGLDHIDWYPNYGTENNYAHGALIHQFTDNGKIDGYGGNLDFSTAKVSIDELKSLGKVTTPPPAETPESPKPSEPDTKPSEPEKPQGTPEQLGSIPESKFKNNTVDVIQKILKSIVELLIKIFKRFNK
jgi:hypothetical protein